MNKRTFKGLWYMPNKIGKNVLKTKPKSAPRGGNKPVPVKVYRAGFVNWKGEIKPIRMMQYQSGLTLPNKRIIIPPPFGVLSLVIEDKDVGIIDLNVKSKAYGDEIRLSYFTKKTYTSFQDKWSSLSYTQYPIYGMKKGEIRWIKNFIKYNSGEDLSKIKIGVIPFATTIKSLYFTPLFSKNFLTQYHLLLCPPLRNFNFFHPRELKRIGPDEG